jgi:hypothetical protein
MTIRSYNDTEFYSKLEELTQLRSPTRYGHIRISGGIQDLVVNENPFLAESSEKIVLFIRKFFDENSFRLTAKELPLLDKIARYMKKKGDTAVAKLDSDLYNYHTQITSFPQEVLIRITATDSLFLSLRAVSRAFYQALPLSLIPRLEKALRGSIFEIQALAEFLCNAIKKKQKEHARYILEQFLFKATEEAQLLFWGSFTSINLEIIATVFDRPFELVSTLCFKLPPAAQQYCNFFASCIYHFPNLQVLRIRSSTKQTLSKNIIAAAINKPSLTVFDCKNLLLPSPATFLTIFAATCNLNEISLRADYSPEIDQAIKKNSERFRGLFLEFLTPPNTADLHYLFNPCSNIESFFLNDVALLPVVPRSIKELTIELQGNRVDAQVISWLAKSELACLHTLKIKNSDFGHIKLKSVLKIAKHFTKLTTLHCHLLVSENPNKEMKRLAVLCERLKDLQLSMDIDTFSSTFPSTINTFSTVNRLKLNLKMLTNSSIPFERLEPIFHACNPTQLCLNLQLDYIPSLPDPSIAKMKYTAQRRIQFSFDNAPNPYLWPENSRLKSVVLKDNNLWKWSAKMGAAFLSIPNIGKQGLMIADIGFFIPQTMQ